MSNKFDKMGKEELRAACREAGISYSKLNNDGMRAALQALEAPAADMDGSKLNLEPSDQPTDAQRAEAEEAEYQAQQLGGYSVFSGGAAPAPTNTEGATVVRDGKKVDPSAPQVEEEEDDAGFSYSGKCPICGAAESSQTWANEGVSCHCHGCGKTYSVKTGREVRAGYTRENVNSGYKILKDRPMQNGLKRPSPGTLCGNVWDALDKLRAEKGMPLASDLPDLAEANGWNKNNVMCEFYQWRKFNGISGRQTRPEAK